MRWNICVVLTTAWGCGGDPAAQVETTDVVPEAVEVRPGDGTDDDGAEAVTEVVAERARVDGSVALVWPLQGRVAGARVSVFDEPDVATITDDLGTFTLEVARDRRLLLLVEADGYMDTLLVYPAPGDDDLVTASIQIFEDGQLVTTYETLSLGSTLAPIAGRAHVRLYTAHPEPSLGWALGATVTGAEPTHYMPWPPIAPVEPLVAATSGISLVANLAPVGSYAMTARSGFHTECVGVSSQGDYAPAFDVPLRADTVTTAYVICPLPEGRVAAFGKLEHPFDEDATFGDSRVCEWQADPAAPDNCVRADAAGEFRMLVRDSPRLALRIEAPAMMPLIWPITRFAGASFQLSDPVYSEDRAVHIAKAEGYARRAGIAPPDPTTVAWLEVAVWAPQRVTLVPASSGGMFLASDDMGTDFEGLLGPVYFPNADPDATDDGFFRVIFETPLRASCLDAWFEDPSTLLVPAQAGYLTRMRTITCD